VINRPTRGFARRAVPGRRSDLSRFACFESGGECISFVDRDCPHQLKAKGFGLCGSVGNQSSKGQSAHLSPKVTFFNVVKNIPCLFPATKVLGSKWAVGAEAGLTESVVDSIR